MRDIDFIKYGFFSFIPSAIIIFLTFGLMALKGFSYGVDFKGGMLIEIQSTSSLNLPLLRKKLFSLTQKDVSLQEFGSPCDALIRLDLPKNTVTLEEKDQKAFLDSLKQCLGHKIDMRRIETVGPKVAGELVYKGVLAIVVAVFAMMLYVSFRFEWPFGVCAILALIHDCISILFFYLVSNYELSETSIVALLITASYSINDTVVIFDRIRENKQKNPSLSLYLLINKSIGETLSRTLYTSFTTLAALVCLYAVGGSVIQSFSLPIIVGLFAGTLSSLLQAAPLLLVFERYLVSEKK